MRDIHLTTDGQPNRDYFDILKGLGILCIALGHCFMPAQNFVYAFHVPLFFFVSGYLYNEEKYGDRPFDNLSSRLRSNWPRYIAIYIIYICLHNVFFHYELLDRGAILYTPREYIIRISSALFFAGDEFLISPLWFVPVLVEASVLLGFIVWMSRRIFAGVAPRLILQFIVVLAAAFVGYIIEASYIALFANLQIALMVMPYIWVGYLLRNYAVDIERYLRWYMALFACIILLLYTRDHLISLKDMRIEPLMYLMAFLGIYVCLYVSIIIYRIDVMRGLFVLLGVASFEIMALHFTIIRIADRLYDGLVRHVDFTEQEYLGHNMILLPIYLIVGMGVPVLISRIRGIHRGDK